MDRARVKAWLFDDALPVWSTQGVDTERGGFVEQLTMDGRPIADADRRLRVQARQTYVFCHAAVMGWQGPAQTLARDGFTRMTTDYWHDDGGWISSASGDGTPRDITRASYEHAFALLALAWYYRATGDPDALIWTRRTLKFLDQRLGDSRHGGYLEALPARAPRRQNPHMHLLEAMMALFAATRDEAYLQRARELVRLFRQHFFDRSTGALCEYFAADWTPAGGTDGRSDGGTDGERVEPGHQFEWIWLLDEFGRLADDPVADDIERLYRSAEAHGVDPDDGLIFDAVSRDGAVLQPTKRAWPQTEALRAQLVVQRRCGIDTAPRWRTILDSLFTHYLSVGRGLWQDQLGNDGGGLAAAVPASTLYHLFGAFAALLDADHLATERENQ